MIVLLCFVLIKRLFRKSSQAVKPVFKSLSGDIQEILERVDEWMKEISKKLEILTEPGGVATRDEGPYIKSLPLHILVNKVYVSIEVGS